MGSVSLQGALAGAPCETPGELGASSMNMGMTEALCLLGNGATWHLRSTWGDRVLPRGHQGSFVKRGHLVQTRRMHRRLERKAVSPVWVQAVLGRL